MDCSGVHFWRPEESCGAIHFFPGDMIPSPEISLSGFSPGCKTSRRLSAVTNQQEYFLNDEVLRQKT